MSILPLRLIFALCIPFLEVLLQTKIASLKENNQQSFRIHPQDSAKKEDKILRYFVLGAKFGLPFMAALFSLAYFTVGLIQSI